MSLYTANADAERCLDAAEKRKFTTMGNSTVIGNTMTREDVLHTLFTDANLLQIWAICPYGGMAHSALDDPIRPLSFTTNRPQAMRTYLESLQSSAPHDILPLANSFQHRSSSKPAHQKFYGHSYTAPTPRAEDQLPPTPTVRPRLHQSVCHPPTHFSTYIGGATSAVAPSIASVSRNPLGLSIRSSPRKVAGRYPGPSA
eukprot:scaffold36756_cov150-Skeletonema_dohrnii-CCMP3373.AAC.2